MHRLLVFFKQFLSFFSSPQNYIFLTDKGLTPLPSPLTDISAKNVIKFFWRLPLTYGLNGKPTGDFIKKLPEANYALRNRLIISIERVYTSSTFYMKSALAQMVMAQVLF